MFKYHNLIALLVVYSFAIGCVSDPPPVLKISPSQIVLTNTNGTEEITVTANAQWTSVVTGDWITISPTSSMGGDAVVKITAKNNFTEDERNASIIFTIGKEGKKNYLKKALSVRQANSQLSVNYTSLNFDNKTGSKVLKISSNTDWTISFSTPASWVTPSTNSGNGDADVSFTVDANSSKDRWVNAVISYGTSDVTVKIFQERAVNSPPGIPLLHTPANNAVNVARLQNFVWSETPDPDEDEVEYRLQISESSSFPQGNQTFVFDAGKAEEYFVPTLFKENTQYYWRVIATDLYNASTSSSTFTFTTGTKGGYANYEYRVAFTNKKGFLPNEVVFMGDGYTINDYIDGGKFDQDIDEGIEAFFAVEPYKSYRDYFKVYKLAVYSKQSGASMLDRGVTRETAFNTTFKSGSSMDTDKDKIFNTVAEVIPGMEDDNPYYSGIQGKIQNTLIVLAVNENRYAGTCWMYTDGKSIAICPVSKDERESYNYKNVVSHEAGGHGFGRLADEYINASNKGQTISESEKSSLNTWTAYGYYPNVDLTSDLSAIKWKHFVGKAGYAVGAHEGAYYYTFGVWRPEPSSCMIDNRKYYNAPSRESIVKRIVRTAAGVRVSDYENGVLKPIQNDPYSFDDFIRQDVRKTESEVLFYTKSYNPLTFIHLAPPVMVVVD